MCGGKWASPAAVVLKARPQVQRACEPLDSEVLSVATYCSVTVVYTSTYAAVADKMTMEIRQHETNTGAAHL
jgi:hypothetical protein